MSSTCNAMLLNIFLCPSNATLKTSRNYWSIPTVWPCIFINGIKEAGTSFWNGMLFFMMTSEARHWRLLYCKGNTGSPAVWISVNALCPSPLYTSTWAPCPRRQARIPSFWSSEYVRNLMLLCRAVFRLWSTAFISAPQSINICTTAKEGNGEKNSSLVREIFGSTDRCSRLSPSWPLGLADTSWWTTLLKLKLSSSDCGSWEMRWIMWRDSWSRSWKSSTRLFSTVNWSPFWMTSCPSMICSVSLAKTSKASHNLTWKTITSEHFLLLSRLSNFNVDNITYFYTNWYLALGP